MSLAALLERAEARHSPPAISSMRATASNRRSPLRLTTPRSARRS